MNKTVISCLLGLAPLAMAGQSAIDAYSVTGNNQLRGTARFMSMGGAFTALGGDISTLNQNPAGIGIYRSSEIAATLDVDIQSNESNTQGVTRSSDQTRVACNNFGYVGSTTTGNETMPYFSWGASYARVASFDRLTRGSAANLSGSLSNYVARFTNGTGYQSLEFGSNYNPYTDSDADWLSIMAYNAYAINNTTNSNRQYEGLWQNGTTGNSMFWQREKGYIDEFNLSFGGNILNTVYWGFGVGITDLDYKIENSYDEELQNARIATDQNVGATTATATTTGNGYFNMDNWKHISGSGFNLKFGLIFKPINEFRVGLAFHTPTWYDINTTSSAQMTYDYASGISSDSGDNYPSQTAEAYYEWKLQSPWRFMIGAAGVIGGKGIISVDYEYSATNRLKVKDDLGYAIDDVNTDIKDYFQAANTVRVGAEYRLTNAFSVRAGFNYTTSDVRDKAADGLTPIYTAGTLPSYTLKKDNYYISCGLGYRINAFSIDAAYVYGHRESTWQAFTPTAYDTAAQSDYSTGAYSSKLTDTNSQLVLSLAYRF
jgi:hypothetical protein